jgi:hypothetical protein
MLHSFRHAQPCDRGKHQLPVVSVECATLQPLIAHHACFTSSKHLVLVARHKASHDLLINNRHCTAATAAGERHDAAIFYQSI